MNKTVIYGIGLFIAFLIILALVLGADTSNIDPQTQLTGPVNSGVIAGQNIPEPFGFVNDNANIIDQDTELKLENSLKAYAATQGPEIAILTVQSMNGLSIEEYGIRVGEKWKVGRKEEDNGAIFIIAVSERKVRIEVGRGLNITDAQAGQILDDFMVPKLKENDWAGALVDGTNALMLKIKN